MFFNTPYSGDSIFFGFFCCAEIIMTIMKSEVENGYIILVILYNCYREYLIPLICTIVLIFTYTKSMS